MDYTPHILPFGIASKIMTHCKRLRCPSCNSPFNTLDLYSYDHEHGVPIEGYKEKQWIFFHCDQCEIDHKIALFL